MNWFLYNLLLALAWVAVSSRFTLFNLLLGFAISYLILWFTARSKASHRYLRKVPNALWLILYFGWELLLANLRVAVEVVTPWHAMRPAVVAVPLDIQGDLEILLMSTLVTLTPDSLTVTVSEDRSTMYIHAMYVESAEAARRRYKEGLERRIMEMTR